MYAQPHFLVQLYSSARASEGKKNTVGKSNRKQRIIMESLMIARSDWSHDLTLSNLTVSKGHLNLGDRRLPCSWKINFIEYLSRKGVTGVAVDLTKEEGSAANKKTLLESRGYRPGSGSSN